MPEADEALDRLESRLQRLKREYDLFFLGQAKEPSALRKEVEREILRLSRQPSPSTAVKFRATGLAHRFRALETQVKNLLEQRSSRRKRPGEAAAQEPERFVLDRVLLEDPALLRSHFERFHRELSAQLGTKAVPPSEALLARLTETARKLLERKGAHAVRFSVAEGESGPKIRGEILGEEGEGKAPRS